VRDAHAHTVPYADTHTDINSHSNSNSDCNAERVTDAYSVTHCYAQSDTQAAPDPAYPSHTALIEIVIGDQRLVIRLDTKAVRHGKRAAGFSEH
jgi:hypothetical protein